MKKEALTSALLFDLGLLHDCRISAVKVTPDQVIFELNDVNANTAGLPEYPGRQPGVLSLRLQDIGASLLAELESLDLPARIYELEIEGTFESHKMTLRLWPNGSFELPVFGAEIGRI